MSASDEWLVGPNRVDKKVKVVVGNHSSDERDISVCGVVGVNVCCGG